MLKLFLDKLGFIDLLQVRLLFNDLLVFTEAREC